MPNNHRLLELALKGLDAERAKLEDEIAEIRRELNNGAKGSGIATKTIAASQPSRPARRRMTTEARKRISSGHEAQACRTAEGCRQEIDRSRMRDRPFDHLSGMLSYEGSVTKSL